MILRQSKSKQLIHAPAKVNLFLEVFDRRDDGFHDLSTLMVPVRLFDSLYFESLPPAQGQSPSIEFSVRSVDRTSDVPHDSNNLVVRALELLRRRSGCGFGARVELMKRIPAGAGLGGGSSDAAAALRVANRMWGLRWQAERLVELAAELGSDVAFFLEPGAAICRGRGERIERVGSTATLNFVIVKPPVSLKTAEVYHALDRLPATIRSAGGAERALEQLVVALRRGTIQQIGQWMVNRLQAAAATVSSWIDRVQSTFAGLDCLCHQMSGSGSAYYGICRHVQHARRLATLLRSCQLGTVYVTRSCS